MRLAISQPYFFPYLGYFALIKHTDRFILLDNVQFIRHGWIERNRILKQNEGWLYIQVPILKPEGRSTLIKDISINNTQNWKEKLLAQLVIYKRIAPFYNNVVELIKTIFKTEFNDIVSLNKASLEIVCDYIGIKQDLRIFSEIGITIEMPLEADEWALNICKSFDGVDEYWNLPGGLDFFDRSKYAKSGIDLKFLKAELLPYNQKRVIFEPGLSVIDVMMFNTKAEIQKMLDNYQLL